MLSCCMCASVCVYTGVVESYTKFMITITFFQICASDVPGLKLHWSRCTCMGAYVHTCIHAAFKLPPGNKTTTPKDLHRTKPPPYLPLWEAGAGTSAWWEQTPASSVSSPSSASSATGRTELGTAGCQSSMPPPAAAGWATPLPPACSAGREKQRWGRLRTAQGRTGHSSEPASLAVGYSVLTPRQTALRKRGGTLDESGAPSRTWHPGWQSLQSWRRLVLICWGFGWVCWWSSPLVSQGLPAVPPHAATALRQPTASQGIGKTKAAHRQAPGAPYQIQVWHRKQLQ